MKHIADCSRSVRVSLVFSLSAGLLGLCFSAEAAPTPQIQRAGTWAAQPSEAEIAAAYPKGEKASVVVELTCILQDGGLLNYCTVSDSPPVTRPFERAALLLVRKFRVSAQDAKKSPTEFVQVKFSIPFKGSLPFPAPLSQGSPKLAPAPLPPQQPNS